MVGCRSAHPVLCCVDDNRQLLDVEVVVIHVILGYPDRNRLRNYFRKRHGQICNIQT